MAGQGNVGHVWAMKKRNRSQRAPPLIRPQPTAFAAIGAVTRHFLRARALPRRDRGEGKARLILIGTV